MARRPHDWRGTTAIITVLQRRGYGKIRFVARKRKKKKRFRAVDAVKALARERVGAPPSEKIIPDSKKKAGTRSKHKPTLGELLTEE